MPRFYARLLFAFVFACSLTLVGCDSGSTDSPADGDADGDLLPEVASFEIELTDGRSLSLSDDLFADAEAFQMPDGTLMKRVYIYSDGDEAGFNAEVPFREGRHRLGTVYADGTDARSIDNLNFTIGEDFFFSDPALAAEAGDTYAEAFIEIARADEDVVTGRIGGTFFNDDGSEVEVVNLSSGVFRIDQVFDEAPGVIDETEGEGGFPYDDGSDEGGDGGGDGGGEEEEDEVIADFEMLVQGPIFDGVYVQDVDFRFEDRSENAVDFEWFVSGDSPDFSEYRFSDTPFPGDATFQPTTLADTSSITVRLRVTGSDGETAEHTETVRFPMVRAYGTYTLDGDTTALRPREGPFSFNNDYFYYTPEAIEVVVCEGLDCSVPSIRISPGPIQELNPLRQTGDRDPVDQQGARSFYVSLGSYATFDDPVGEFSDGNFFLDTILSENDYDWTFLDLTMEATLRNRNDPDNEADRIRVEVDIQNLPNICYVYASSPFCRNQETP